MRMLGKFRPRGAHQGSRKNPATFPRSIIVATAEGEKGGGEGSTDANAVTRERADEAQLMQARPVWSINLQLADNGERSSPADGKGADWRSKKAKHGINKLQSSRSNKEEDRKIGDQRAKEVGGGERTGWRLGIRISGKPRLYRGSGLFEARRRSSSRLSVKVARIDRTAGLSSTTSIDGDYFRHRISTPGAGEAV